MQILSLFTLLTTLLLFFIVPGLGLKRHSYHNQKPLSENNTSYEMNKQLSSENEKFVANMDLGKLSSTQIQTAVFQSSGDLLSLSTIYSITEYYSKDIINDDEFDGIFEGRGNDINCTEYIMKFCNGNTYNFMLLLNDPFILSAPISDVFFPG